MSGSVVVLKNCETELLYLPSDLFNMCLKESCFADPLSVVSDRIVKAFNRSRTTQAVVLNISKDFSRVQIAGLLHKLKSY